MVAANYAAKRSELARSIGLGQSRRKASAADGGASADAPGPVETGEAASEAPQPKKRARKAQAAE
jgi:hypothetical protein